MNLTLTGLFVALAVAVVTDIRSRKIKNSLVMSGMAWALVMHLLPLFGEFLSFAFFDSFYSYTIGIAVGFAALFPLYALRAMGAGDVKLMMMVGAFLGPMQTLGVVVLTFVAGGVLAIFMALWHRSYRQLATNLRFMLTTSAVQVAGGGSARFEPLAQTAGRMPYAVAIAAGTVLQLILVRSGGWALS